MEGAGVLLLLRAFADVRQRRRHAPPNVPKLCDPKRFAVVWALLRADLDAEEVRRLGGGSVAVIGGQAPVGD